jgi:hypothetical protein
MRGLLAFSNKIFGALAVAASLEDSKLADGQAMRCRVVLAPVDNVREALHVSPAAIGQVARPLHLFLSLQSTRCTNSSALHDRELSRGR